MKREITLFVLCTIFVTAGFCQIKVESSGKTTIGLLIESQRAQKAETTRLQTLIDDLISKKAGR